MRNLKNYSFTNYLSLAPLIDQVKEFRNDFICNKYINTAAQNKIDFESLKALKNKQIISLVAFNVPELIEWSLKVNSQYLNDVHFLVFDNSNDLEARNKIEAVCKAHNTPYISLPKNPVKHPSRSHGIALSWIYNNIITLIKPNIFGFIDHDIFLMKKISLSSVLKNAPFYGVLKESDWAWNMWAGFSFFNFEAVKNYPLYFLNDRPNGLDTGGRNWHVLYKHFNKSELDFADYQRINLTDTDTKLSFECDLIDAVWLHFRGAYTTNFNKKEKNKTYNKQELIIISEKIFNDYKVNNVH